MTEQRLQEVEASIVRIECSDCEQGRVFWGTFEDGPDYAKCETCDGSGMVSQFPPADELIAAVRTLTADLAQARAERDEARLEVIGAVARKEAAQAENAALRAALTAAQELLELPETCVVCSAILEPREDEAPHCYDCVVTDEHEAERQDRITQLEIALAQAAPAQASGL